MNGTSRCGGGRRASAEAAPVASVAVRKRRLAEQPRTIPHHTGQATGGLNRAGRNKDVRRQNDGKEQRNRVRGVERRRTNAPWGLLSDDERSHLVSRTNESAKWHPGDLAAIHRLDGQPSRIDCPARVERSAVSLYDALRRAPACCLNNISTRRSTIGVCGMRTWSLVASTFWWAPAPAARARYSTLSASSAIWCRTRWRLRSRTARARREVSDDCPNPQESDSRRTHRYLGVPLHR